MFLLTSPEISETVSILLLIVSRVVPEPWVGEGAGGIRGG